MTRRVAVVVAAVAIVAAMFVTAMNVGTHTSERPNTSDEPGLTLSASALPEPVHAVPAQCVDAINVRPMPASAVAWSPDGTALAVSTNEGGRDLVAVLRAPGWTPTVSVSGSDAHWSASGKVIAVARGSAVAVLDANTGRDVASVTPAAPGFGWSGDTLLYWDGTRLRGWSDGHSGTVGAHIPDITPLSGAVRLSVSADGSRYALTSPSAVMVGETGDGRLAAIARVSAIAWSAFGSVGLVSYAGGERGYLGKLLFGAQSLPPMFAGWSPDGTQALLGPAPSGPTWDVIGWAGTKNGDATRIPSGLRGAVFAPNAAALAGISEGSLRLYRCGDAARSSTYVTREQAKQLVEKTGDLIMVNISDSRLVRWTDIAAMLTGEWAVRDTAADHIAPTDLVWVLMYAGEARRPDGVKWDQPTVNLILYVLDARDGTRLARRIANGTWWIGEPFESMGDRAPDATSHPFEPRATNPIQMPTPKPTPTLKSTPSTSGLAIAESPEAGWSLSYPDGWWPSRAEFGGAVLSTRSPGFGLGGSLRLPGDYDDAAALYIEVWPNPDRLDAPAFADRRFVGNTMERAQSQSALTLAGQPAVTWLVRSGPNPPDNRYVTKRYWIVPTLGADRILMITASGADSVYASELERAVSSLRLAQPVSVTRTPDVTRQQVLERWTSMKTPPARVEAKLVTYADAARAENSFAINPLRHDPDGLVWIVAVFDPTGQLFGPTRGLVSSAQAYRWQLYIAPAYTDDTAGGMWSQLSSHGDWPTIFDTMVDRCC